jgi:hypothetical protein
MQTPSCGYLAIHRSPKVTLVHLAANPIPEQNRTT